MAMKSRNTLLRLKRFQVDEKRRHVAQIEQALPIQRVGAELPAVHNGYFADDKTYSAGGRSLARASVRSYA